MKRSSQEVSDSIQSQSGEFQLSNREQMPQEQFRSSEEERDSTACTVKDAIRNQTHGAGKDISKIKILSIRLLAGLSTEQPELGASNTRFARDHLSRLDQAGNGNGDAGGSRAHQTCGELAE